MPREFEDELNQIAAENEPPVQKPDPAILAQERQQAVERAALEKAIQASHGRIQQMLEQINRRVFHSRGAQTVYAGSGLYFKLYRNLNTRQAFSVTVGVGVDGNVSVHTGPTENNARAMGNVLGRDWQQNTEQELLRVLRSDEGYFDDSPSINDSLG